ncbi:hypothetical protein KIPB_013892, partial [Kipferlia bialata]
EADTAPESEIDTVPEAEASFIEQDSESDDSEGTVSDSEPTFDVDEMRLRGITLIPVDAPRGDDANPFGLWRLNQLQQPPRRLPEMRHVWGNIMGVVLAGAREFDVVREADYIKDTTDVRTIPWNKVTECPFDKKRDGVDPKIANVVYKN